MTKVEAFKTQIMYKANLGFSQLNEYLSLLLELELIEVHTEDKREIYKTTSKGLEYLKRYREILSMLKG